MMIVLTKYLRQVALLPGREKLSKLRRFGQDT